MLKLYSKIIGLLLLAGILEVKFKEANCNLISYFSVALFDWSLIVMCCEVLRRRTCPVLRLAGSAVQPFEVFF